MSFPEKEDPIWDMWFAYEDAWRVFDRELGRLANERDKKIFDANEKYLKADPELKKYKPMPEYSG